MYKMVCIDMDGTLLNSKRKISEVNKKILKQANEKGVHIVITTGRIYCNAEYYSNLLQVNSAVIAANGSIIKEKNQEIAINISVIPKETNLKILDICNKYRVNPNFQTARHIYGGNGLISFLLYYFAFKTGSKEHEVKIHNVRGNKNWEKVLENEKAEMIKCEIFHSDKGRMKKVRSAIEALGELQVVSSGEYGIDITHKGVSKGTAVEVLAKHYNIKREEIIAIGDSLNDVEMIEYAGLGVAMGNAKEQVKKVADYIAPTNDEDGVARVIEKFILSKV